MINYFFLNPYLIDIQMVINHIQLNESDTICDGKHIESYRLDAKHIELNKTYRITDLQSITQTENLLR